TRPACSGFCRYKIFRARAAPSACFQTRDGSRSLESAPGEDPRASVNFRAELKGIRDRRNNDHSNAAWRQCARYRLLPPCGTWLLKFPKTSGRHLLRARCGSECRSRSPIRADSERRLKVLKFSFVYLRVLRGSRSEFLTTNGTKVHEGSQRQNSRARFHEIANL